MSDFIFSAATEITEILFAGIKLRILLAGKWKTCNLLISDNIVHSLLWIVDRTDT